MAIPTVDVKYGPITRRLHIIKRNGESLTQPLKEIGEQVILPSIEENFMQQGRYKSADSWEGGSNRWQPLADATIKARTKKGKWPGKILQQSQGGLADANDMTVSGDNLIISNNKVYAPIQDKGGKAGRNKKVTIPARHFMVVQDEDLEDSMDILGKHINPPKV